MFTIEIAGKAIAMANLSEKAEADDLFGSEAFRDDLRAMESDGTPLWDGSAPILIRASTEDEIEEFELAVYDDEDEDSGEASDGDGDDDEDGIDIVFLVAIDDEAMPDNPKRLS